MDFVTKSVVSNQMSSASASFGNDGTEAGINWSLHNYPRCWPIAHFDPDRDPIANGQPRSLVRFMHWTYRFWMLGLTASLVMTVILVAIQSRSGLAILYALIYMFVGWIIGFFTLFQGYKGVITGQEKFNVRYYYLQAAITCAMFLFSILSSGNVNGFVALGDATPTAGVAPIVPAQYVSIFTTVVVIQGIMWSAFWLFSALTAYRIYRYQKMLTARLAAIAQGRFTEFQMQQQQPPQAAMAPSNTELGKMEAGGAPAAAGGAPAKKWWQF